MSPVRKALHQVRSLLAPRRPGVVLALGGGGAAGLAHIGVVQVLVENHVPVRAIAGTSIGAEIGAFCAAGVPAEELASIATSFDWKQTLALFVPDLPTGGLVSGVRILDFLRSRLGQKQIEDLAVAYVAIASDLETGEEVVLDRGDLVDAVRASVSIPGLIAPHRYDGRALIDGGVLNPLPLDVARERFGGPVIAVAVHRAARTPPRPRTRLWHERADQLLDQSWITRVPVLRAWLRDQLRSLPTQGAENIPWTARRVVDRVFEMSQAQIVRLRAMRTPPDLMIVPDVHDIGVLEFYRAKEIIAAGRDAAQMKLAEIKRLAGAAA